jgi:hypothetical protein
MEIKLSGVDAPAVATSMMGSLHGAVNTWDSTYALSDLFGYSGHAFILNIERTLCPSGPTAWDWGAILFPLRQIVSLKRICATCDMRDADEARELIWLRSVEAISANHPVIIWDAILPEFYLVYGIDDEKCEYFVHGPASGRVNGKIPMNAPGRHTGRVWALFPAPHEHADKIAARNLALRGAVNWHKWHNEDDAQWVFGGDAWDVWINALQEDEMPHDAGELSYNHTVFAECRRNATEFLTNQGEDFAEAAAEYNKVAGALEEMCKIWPFPAPAPDKAVRKELIDLLKTAKEAEDKAVNSLKITLDTKK